MQASWRAPARAALSHDLTLKGQLQARTSSALLRITACEEATPRGSHDCGSEEMND